MTYVALLSALSVASCRIGSMTTPDHEPSAEPPQAPQAPATRDRIYRSPGGLAGGVLLLVIVGWLGIDALVRGHGNTPWVALATLLLVVPLIVGFGLRPAVFAGDDRLRVRNPLRVIVLPWGQIAALRSGYTNEVLTRSGTKFQLWAIPVSLRGRKKAVRRQARKDVRARRGDGGRPERPGLFGGIGGFGGFGGGSSSGLPDAGQGRATASSEEPVRAETDKVMDDLRELLESRRDAGTAQGEVTVRWSYEVFGPALAGAVLLAVLLGIG